MIIEMFRYQHWVSFAKRSCDISAAQIDFFRETDEDVLIQESSKILFLMKLVKNLKEEDHRVLIFSQSRKMLDIVDKVLTKEVCKNAQNTL